MTAGAVGLVASALDRGETTTATEAPSTASLVDATPDSTLATDPVTVADPGVSDPSAMTATSIDSSAGSDSAAAGGSPRDQLGSGNAVIFAFGGDVHLDGPLASTLANNPDALFDGVQPLLSSADVAVINLETAVTEGGSAVGKQFTFRTPKTIYPALMAAGVDVIASANNHTLDYGRNGFEDTLAAAAETQAPVIGIGANEDAAFAPWTATVKGQRVSVINASDVLDAQYVSSWTATATQGGLASAKNTERLLSVVRAARAASDTVVVFLHWGTEATTCPNERQKSLAAQLVTAGADIIVGGHHHRVLSGGFLGDAYVGYGLGNFIFKTSSAAGRQTGVLEITATGRRIDNATWHPGRIGGDFTPALLSGSEADAALKSWNDLRNCTGLSVLPSDATTN